MQGEPIIAGKFAAMPRCTILLKEVIQMTTHNTNQSQSENLLRLREVLKRFPVSRSTWYSGVAEGRYPAPIKLGRRAVAWRESDIERLIADCSDS